jgi:hypothetical protein
LVVRREHLDIRKREQQLRQRSQEPVGWRKKKKAEDTGRRRRRCEK